MNDQQLERILTQLDSLRNDVAEIRRLLESPTQRILPFPSDPVTLEEAEQLVTLDQAAAMVRRKKRSLERYLKEMPKPRIRGGRGHPSMWRWEDLRPWLETVFGFVLPERFPA